jgi:hypothetical protein
MLLARLYKGHTVIPSIQKSNFFRFSWLIITFILINPLPMITDLKEIENSALSLNKKDKARLADKLL